MALKLGTENKKQVAIAAALGVVVLLMVIRALVSSLSGGPAVSAPGVSSAAPAIGSEAGPQPATPQPTPRTTIREAPKAAHLGSNLDPTLHFEVMQQAEALEYTGRGRNIFSPESAPLAPIPTPNRPIRPENVEVANLPTGPPPPPPIDLKFFGYSAQTTGSRKAFLMHGEDVFIASEGEVVDHRYRVVKISPFSVQMEDLPYHNTQTISLTAN